MTFGRGDMRRFRPVFPLRSKFSSLEDGGTGKFPADYMFMLTEDELSDLRSRFLTANARAANPSRRFNHEIHEKCDAARVVLFPSLVAVCDAASRRRFSDLPCILCIPWF